MSEARLPAPGASTPDLSDLQPLLPGLHTWLPRQRWVTRPAAAATVRLIDAAALPGEAGVTFPIAFIAIDDAATATAAQYWAPLAPIALAPDAEPLGATVSGVTLADGFASPACCRALLRLLQSGAQLPTAGGSTLVLQPAHEMARLTPALTPEAIAELPVRLLRGEQSNSSIVFGDRLILKAFRRLARGGPNPDLEVTRFLTEPTADRTGARFAGAPPLAGWAELEGNSDDVEPVSLAVLQRFVPNEGDGWAFLTGRLREYRDEAYAAAADDDMAAADAVTRRFVGDSLNIAAQLGSVTARLHLALGESGATDRAFRPEPTLDADVAAWAGGMRAQVGRVLPRLADAEIAPALQPLVQRVLAAQGRLSALGGGLVSLAGARTTRIRIHGDYHLGQVLRTRDGFAVLDFEGEPLRPIAERRAKTSPLKDVAGMLRSFNYARHAVAREPVTPTDAERFDFPAALATWEEAVRHAFLNLYFSQTIGAGATFLPADAEAARQALRAYELDKAIYELDYELTFRPDWVAIPLTFVAETVSSPTA